MPRIEIRNPLKKSKEKSNYLSARKVLARKLRAYREKHFTNNWEQRRTLKIFNDLYHFNMLKYLAENFQHQEVIHVLDSGAGHLTLANDIKEVLGAKVHLTTLTLIHPKGTRETQKNAHNATTQENLFYPPAIREYTNIKSRKIDEIRVTSAERMKTNKKYDIILDIYGPLFYSNYKELVMNNYLESLKEGGVILTRTQQLPTELEGPLIDKVSKKSFIIEINPATPNSHIHAMRVKWL